MSRYFLDSSALAKAYHAETGTAKILALFAGEGHFNSLQPYPLSDEDTGLDSISKRVGGTRFRPDPTQSAKT